ncbi:T9SS C-terminal target domain-containing protein [Lacihabitans sp. LS3-19]|uniref:T9SS type A sorting domain-containing protein n=1 Tax=Lacihabitans sp. LS3-19 TaxID=2487335 RepID=UPI0020CFC3FA|nr:T9SS type A sorting domain-containing protein [Lacihabitans sp. LS3-19]MCP9767702.1 T9SS C-terminal target domain-containing protein [Lacihabitans sp. LS3-19]
MKKILFFVLFSFGYSYLSAQQIRSILINPPGTDSPLEFFEIMGTPGQSLNGLCFLLIDGDATGAGVIRQKISLSGQTIGSNGLFLWRASTSVLTTSTPANSTSVNTADFSPDLQNGTGTFILMQCPNQVIGNDIDDLNDGTPNVDLTNGGSFTVYDAVSITDGGATDIQYGSYFSGTNIPVKTGTTSTTAEYVFRDGGTFYGASVVSNGGFIEISSVANSSWNSGGSTGAFNGLQLANGTSTSSVFPLDLLSFEAKRNYELSINLLWQTTSESNFSHFEIQRSTDAKSFETIGKVKGDGSLNAVSEYAFVDEKPLDGINYYRLKQVDIDNSFEFSKIISVNLFLDGQVEVYPNPCTDFITLKNVKKEEISDAYLYNNNGKLLKTWTQMSGGFDISDVSAGNLVLEVRLVDTRIIKKRIVKQ